MFESLDQMSAPSNSAEDEPIAWYEPQEDEQFEDKGSKLACRTVVFRLAHDE